MSEDSIVSIPLTHDVARAIITGIAGFAAAGYHNSAWDWWRNDAKHATVYSLGNVKVTLEQIVDPSNDYEFPESYSYNVQMVFSLVVEAIEWESMMEQRRFYRIDGEFSSYGGSEWDEHSFREVRPTEKVIREFV